MSTETQEALALIGKVNNLSELREISNRIRHRWIELSRQEAVEKASNFHIGQKVRLKRKGLVGVIEKFGPKNIVVKVDYQKWRCHPALLEAVDN